MKPHHWLAIGALLGAVGVSLGAFGAHNLPKTLASLGYDDAEAARRLDIFETGARYQIYSAFAVLAAGFGAATVGGRGWPVAGWLLLIGGVWFSGLLYALAFVGDGWRWLGAVVPIGGGAMIGGWLALAVAGARAAKNRPTES